MSTPKDSKAGRAMVRTDRDTAIIRDVADFQILTREQLQRLGHFGSRTRANAVLARLVRFGYLSRRYQPAVAGAQRALYLIGPESALLLNQSAENVGSQRRRIQTLSDLFVEHQLLVNSVRLSFHQAFPGYSFTRWMNEADLRAMMLGFVPDGHVEYTFEGASFGAFLELDRGTETLARWQTKVRAYAQLASSGKYKTSFGRQYFRVLAVSPSQKRIDHLRRTTARLTDRIFWFATLAQLEASGPFSSIWLRPVDPQLHALNET